MTETVEIIYETTWEWGAPDEDLCPIRDCGGVLRDHALEMNNPMGGHGYEWRQCGRCSRVFDSHDSELPEGRLPSWAVA